ncbi:MAG: hypothetical protein AAF226_01015, partial [Verrucomicrobiota bacterium]
MFRALSSDPSKRASARSNRVPRSSVVELAAQLTSPKLDPLAACKEVREWFTDNGADCFTVVVTLVDGNLRVVEGKELSWDAESVLLTLNDEEKVADVPGCRVRRYQLNSSKLTAVTFRLEKRYANLISQDGFELVSGILYQKFNEHLLQDNIEEQKYFSELLLDSVPCVVGVKDENGRFERANKALAEFYGIS